MRLLAYLFLLLTLPSASARAEGDGPVEVPGSRLHAVDCARYLLGPDGDELASRLRDWLGSLETLRFEVRRQESFLGSLRPFAPAPSGRPLNYNEKVALGLPQPGRALPLEAVRELTLTADDNQFIFTSYSLSGAELGTQAVPLAGLRLGFFYKVDQWQFDRYFAEATRYHFLDFAASIRRFLIEEGVFLLDPGSATGRSRRLGYLFRISDIDVESGGRQLRVEPVIVQNCDDLALAKHDILFPAPGRLLTGLNLCVQATGLLFSPLP